jgi:hypothetical protein
MGLAKPQSTIQQMTHFFQEKEEDLDMEEAGNDGQEQRKIKSCAVCKVQKSNHIVKAFANTTSNANNTSTSPANLSGNLSAIGGFALDKTANTDSLRHGVLNLAPREVIEQIVFDPQHGIVKREIHFGIIDYLTVS